MRGNLISFQVYFDSKGNLMTELSKLPLEGLSLFNDADRPYVKKILNEAGLKLWKRTSRLLQLFYISTHLLF